MNARKLFCFIQPLLQAFYSSAFSRTLFKLVVLACTALEQAYRILSEMLAILSPARWQMSLERVPEHQAILAAW